MSLIQEILFSFSNTNEKFVLVLILTKKEFCKITFKGDVLLLFMGNLRKQVINITSDGQSDRLDRFLIVF